MQILALFFFLVCAFMGALSCLAMDDENSPSIAFAILAFLMFEIGRFILGGCG